MNKRLIIGLTILVALAAGAGYAYHEYYRPHVSMANATSDFDSEAVALIREFESNEAKANKKYLSKVLIVQGMVKAVDSAGGWVISLGDTITQTSVRCLMDSLFRGTSPAIVRGNQISIKGYCTGFNADELLGSDVLLDRCVLHKTIIITTAK